MNTLSPAEAIVKELRTNAMDIFGTADVPIFEQVMPQDGKTFILNNKELSTDNAVAVKDTGGGLAYDRMNISEATFQVKVRHCEMSKAKDWIFGVRNYLDSKPGFHVDKQIGEPDSTSTPNTVITNFKRICFTGIWILHEPLYIERDTDNRDWWSVNFRAMVSYQDRVQTGFLTETLYDDTADYSSQGVRSGQWMETNAVMPNAISDDDVFNIKVTPDLASEFWEGSFTGRTWRFRSPDSSGDTSLNNRFERLVPSATSPDRMSVGGTSDTERKILLQWIGFNVLRVELTVTRTAPYRFENTISSSTNKGTRS